MSLKARCRSAHAADPAACTALSRAPAPPLHARAPQLQGPASQFYKSALLLLSYQPLDKMAPADALTLSFDLGLAALVAKSVYNFGELLHHPVVARLESTEHAWLAQILRVFNAGDIELYEQLIGAHRAQLEAQPALVAHAAFLKEKVALMSLMELVFGHVGPQADHSLSFELIAQRVRLPVAEVGRRSSTRPRAARVVARPRLVSLTREMPSAPTRRRPRMWPRRSSCCSCAPCRSS